MFFRECITFVLVKKAEYFYESNIAYRDIYAGLFCCAIIGRWNFV